MRFALRFDCELIAELARLTAYSPAPDDPANCPSSAPTVVRASARPLSDHLDSTTAPKISPTKQAKPPRKPPRRATVIPGAEATEAAPDPRKRRTLARKASGARRP